LNDEAFSEFSQAMAARVLAESKNDDQRIQRAFRYCLSRSPSAEEKERLRKLLDDEITALKRAPEDVKQIIGSKPPENVDRVQFAAWKTVSRVILNLDETITRE